MRRAKGFRALDRRTSGEMVKGVDVPLNLRRDCQNRFQLSILATS